jgi:CRP/FNR family cyclic AMP-dependent transcriptional regulator
LSDFFARAYEQQNANDARCPNKQCADQQLTSQSETGQLQNLWGVLWNAFSPFRRWLKMRRAKMSKSKGNSRPPKENLTPISLLESAGRGRAITTYRPEEIIFAQGDDADSVFYIKKGKVKITVVSPQGKEAVVAILGADDFVGEGCLIGQRKRLATLTSMTECEIICIDKSEIHKLLRSDSIFSQIFVSHLMTKHARTEEDLVDQLFNSTEKRLARVLLLLANFGKEGRPEPILGKITQEILAEMIGSTRSRVSIFMNKFRKAGLIDYNGHIEVHSSLLSVVLADIPRSIAPPL